MRWVGIDEAGYGPNLGPLVMTAVVAEGPDDHPPDLWRDLAGKVDRAQGDAECLWIDDSKRIYRAGNGLDRLEAGSLAALVSSGRALPVNLTELLAGLQAGSLVEAELNRWLEPGVDPAVPREPTRPMLERTLERRPFDGAPWRIIAMRAVVVGPSQFNAALECMGSKAKAHFAAFARLLTGLWEQAADGVVTRVRADKHGGRHFYLEPLYRAIPDSWIDRGDEGAELSRYTIRLDQRRLELTLCPRADGDDGLVALASMVSKMVREHWMEAFNAYWTARIDGLRPCAGYPGDSARFREAVEPECRAMGLEPDLWWRAR